MAVTSVASSTTSTTLLAAGERRAVIIENSDANRLYILLDDDGTASATNRSFSLGENENASVPQSYTGAIKGVWAADGSGYAHITSY